MYSEPVPDIMQLLSRWTLQNGEFLDSCICLGSNSSYTASEHDGVFLEEQAESSSDDSSSCSNDKEGSDEPGHEVDNAVVDEIMFDLQVRGTSSAVSRIARMIPISEKHGGVAGHRTGANIL